MLVRLFWIALGVSTSGLAFAHGFGAAYNLPVPLALYNWGAAATLVLSFLLAGLFWSKPPDSQVSAGLDLSQSLLVRSLIRVLPVLQMLAVLLLVLCVVTGFFGSRDPLRNFAPIFFWIVVLLVFAYSVVFIGNAYAALNPFQLMARWLLKLAGLNSSGLFRYPKQMADWPALFFYLCFIWFELFSHRTPKSLATFLFAYTLLNLCGVILIGYKHWFRHCEFFALFFRLLAQMAPLDYGRASTGQYYFRLRAPLSGLIRERAHHISTVVFILAMISTTAFDGLQATQWWVGLFWYQSDGLVSQLVGGEPIRHMRELMPIYMTWQSLCLFISPFVYLLAYLIAMSIAKFITRSSRSLLELAKDFAYTLLPIALVYNVTHYWTLITAHGLKIFSLLSDPFGWRWDLFGTAMKFRAPILPDMGFVWHSQLGLILFGHVLSVWLAHVLAIRVWRTRGAAMLSQLPILILMVSFTVFGLWVLAQPLTQIRPQ